MTKVKFFDPSFDPGTGFTYAIIAARFCHKWIYVRHNKRTTWEIAGGHIEKGETSDEAASRELMEETGALNFDIERVATYSVRKNGSTGWGRLYLATVRKLGPVPDDSEIAEIFLSEHFPEENTHPDIQPLLYKKILEYLERK